MKREDREREERLRDRQAQILGIDRAELDRARADQARGVAKKGHAGLTPVAEPVGAIAARLGVQKLAYDTCGRCGRKVPERNELGGQPLRCDPMGKQGLVCVGFFDETGQRIDCYDELDRIQAEQFGRELAAAKRRAAEHGEQGKPKKSRRGQLSLTGEEGPPF